MRTEMLEAALDYARKGWPVFPVYAVENGRCACGRFPCGKDNRHAGKHPRTQHGLSDATLDEIQIREWWTAHPDSNIGGATGAPSGRCVLDVDAHKEGTEERLEALEAEHGRLPETPVSLTGRGGQHVVYSTNGRAIKSRNDALGPGLDFKCDGGYVILPPSRHACGRLYAWNAEAHPDELPLADLPEWIERTVNGPTTKSPKPTTETPRHNRVRDLAWKLAPTMPRKEAIEYVERYARGVGLDLEGRIREAQAAVESAYRKREDAQQDDLDDAALGRVDLSAITDPNAGKARWYVHDLLPESSIVLVAARWKTGKTFAIYCAILEALAKRRVWGTFPVERDDLRVLIWQFEMPADENIRRLRKLALGLGIEPDQIPAWQQQGRLELYAQSPLDLKNPKHIGMFHNRVETYDPHIVLIDSAGEAGFTISKNEEVRAELKAALNTLTRAGRCVVIMTHKRKGLQGAKADDDGDSIIGAQSWAAKASRIYTLDQVGKEKAPGDFIVKLESQRGWGLVETPTLYLRVHDEEINGEFATRVEPMEESEVQDSGAESKLNRAKRQLLEALEGVDIYGYKALIDKLVELGNARSTAQKAYRELTDAGTVENVDGRVRKLR